MALVLIARLLIYVCVNAIPVGTCVKAINPVNTGSPTCLGSSHCNTYIQSYCV